jgi:hypothetical protein
MGKRKRQRRSFTPEFKAEAVTMVQQSGKSVAMVARELDLTETAPSSLRPYCFLGFPPLQTVVGIFGDPRARVVTLVRRSKTVCGACGRTHRGFYDRTARRVRDLRCGGITIFLEIALRRVACRRCGAVRRERLDFLADNPRYTQRFALSVDKRCRSATIKDIADELGLEWHTVQELEKQYMRAQLRRVGTPGPKVLGIDEISIRKGHTYRIVVSDLVRRRPIWFGGTDRSEARMDQFVTRLPPSDREGAVFGNERNGQVCLRANQSSVV